MEDQWDVFKTQLLSEYSVEDQSRVTKKSFYDWIEKGNKGLLITYSLHEFKRQFSQLCIVALEKLDLLL